MAHEITALAIKNCLEILKSFQKKTPKMLGICEALVDSLNSLNSLHNYSWFRIAYPIPLHQDKNWFEVENTWSSRNAIGGQRQSLLRHLIERFEADLVKFEKAEFPEVEAQLNKFDNSNHPCYIKVKANIKAKYPDVIAKLIWKGLKPKLNRALTLSENNNSSLSIAFVWNKTKEGYDFWKSIYAELYD